MGISTSTAVALVFLVIALCVLMFARTMDARQRAQEASEFVDLMMRDEDDDQEPGT